MKIMPSQMRWKERFENFQKAYLFFESALEQSNYSQLEIAGLVQSFEFTFELAWKTIKDFLYSQGSVTSYPREALKQAYKVGMLENGHIWIEMLEKRNALAHTYNSKVADDALDTIKFQYFPEISQAYKLLKSEYDKNE